MADLATITIPVNTSQVNMAIGTIGKLEGQIVKLERARQRGIITDQQFDKSLAALSKRMNKFAADTKQAEAEILRFGSSVRDADAKTLNNLGRGLGESQKGFARFGLAAQQSGYQVGDFFVQIASGTSPMVAFTQQFSQLAGFFGGPWGAVVGAIAAIGGAAYIAFSGATKEVDTFQESLDNLKKSTEDMKLEIAVSQQGFDNNEQKLLYDEIVKKGQEINALELERQAIAATANRYTGLMVVAKQREIDSAEAGLKILQDQLDENYKLVRAVEKEKQVRDLMEKGLSRSVISAMELAGVDLANLSDGAIAAGLIATRLNLAYGDAYRIATQYDKLLENTGQSSGPDAVRTRQFNGGAFAAPVRGAGLAFVEPKGLGGAGGGGVDPAEQLRKQYESLMGSLDPLVAAQNQYNDSLTMLNEALAKGAINQQEFQLGLDGIKKKLLESQDPLASFKKSLEDALDPNKNYMKGLQALQSSLSDFLFNPFEVGVKGMIYSFSQALQRMASDALAAGFMKMLVGGIGGAGGSFGSAALKFLGGSANGNVFDNGSKVTAFANGGVVGSPTMFPLKGGMGLMGEAGPEAIMPLKRGSDGKLGVQMQGADSGAKSTKIINVLDPRIVGEYLNTPDGEEVIMNVMRRTGVV